MVTFHPERKSSSRLVGLVITLLIVVGCLSEASVVNADTTYLPVPVVVVSASTSPSVFFVKSKMPSQSEVDGYLGAHSSSKATNYVFKSMPLDWVSPLSNTYKCLGYAGGSNSWAYGTFDTKTINISTVNINGTGSGYADCSTAGEYFIAYRDVTASSTFQWLGSYNFTGSTVTIGTTTSSSSPVSSSNLVNSTQYNTRFLTVTVTGTTTNPKDAIVDVSYYLDPNEINRNISGKNPTQIILSWSDKSTQDIEKQGFTIPTTTGTGTIRMRIPDASIADSGSFDLLVTFGNTGCFLGLSDCPFPLSYMYTSFDLSSKVVTTQGEVENYNTLTFSAVEEPCSLTNISGCISNAFAFLFIPSEASVSRFVILNETLSNKFPFAYAYDFSSTINTLYTTTATESGTLTVPFGTFGNITLISSAQLSAVPFASFIKSLLGYALWIMFMIAMYRRTLTIFNPSPV